MKPRVIKARLASGNEFWSVELDGEIASFGGWIGALLMAREIAAGGVGFHHLYYTTTNYERVSNR